jgi:intracellular septation protein
MSDQKPSATTPKGQALSLFFGGLLPVIAFTVIEEKYGPQWGLLAGLSFGVAEIIYELIRYKKVSTITWIGNGLLIALGLISLFASDGIWFKLQPAIMEFGMFAFLFGSWILKKPFMQVMVEKQNPNFPDIMKPFLAGITLRLSIFFLLHSVIATHAAFYWSTEAWAYLKGLGLMISMVLYMIIEMVIMKRKIQK